MQNIFRRRTSLANRIAVSVSLLIAAILGAVISLVGIRLNGDIQKLVREANLQIVMGYSKSITTALNGYYWGLRVLSMSDQVSKAEIDDANDYVVKRMKGNFADSIDSLLLVLPDGKAESPTGTELDFSGMPFMKAIFEDGKDFVSGSLGPSKVSGEPVVLMVKAVTGEAAKPKAANSPAERPKAAICAEFKLAMLSKFISSFKAGKGAYMWIVDQDGLVISHPDQKSILSLNALESGSQGYAGLDALAARMAKEASGSGSFVAPGGERLATFFAKISLSPGSGWRLCLSVPERDLYAPVAGLITMLAIVLAVSLALGAALSIAISRSIIRPIKLVASEFRGLSSGDADLTKELSVASRDEVGDLSRDFNSFVGKLREMVLELKRTQASLAAIGDELRSSAKGSASAVEAIIQRADRMRDQAAEQDRGVAESSAAVEQIAGAIEGLDRLISSQSASISEASASIEQMVSNIASVSKSITTISQGFEDISRSSEDGIANQRASSERVAEIAALSANLLDANEVIASIASQTNLLAMNAAIEAAHAGDAGRGFSVVADEIRKLAETSTEQSKSIGSGLKKVQSGIESVVETSSRTGDSFTDLADKIERTASLVREVGTAMVEQREGSSQILVALKEMNEISGQVLAGSREMKTGNSSNLEAIARLRASARELAGGIEEVAEGIRDLERESSSIESVAGRTGGLIDSLEDSVGRFRA